jgi:hypothetical protein
VVEYVALYNWLTYPADTTDGLDIKVGPATLERVLRNPSLEDVALGECLLHDAACRSAPTRSGREVPQSRSGGRW